ncbi:SYT15-like protein, partial [Mya arenaria]
AYALGSIDPILYRIADEDDDYDIPQDHLGRAWFAVQYEKETEKLLVIFIKAKNLPSKACAASNGCVQLSGIDCHNLCTAGINVSAIEPLCVTDLKTKPDFFKIYLKPGERRYLQSKLKKKQKKKTRNPKFEESYVFQGNINAQRYVSDVLNTYALPLIRQQGPGVTLMHDNARPHVASVTTQFLQQYNVNVMPWPAVSPDLNPIEQIWDQLGRKARAYHQIDYVRDLTRALQQEWRNLPNALVLRYVTSMRRRIIACIHANDSYIKVHLMVQNKLVNGKKTEIIKKNINPVFNESFTFKLPVVSLDTANITLTAMKHQTGYKDKMIGKVTIGSFMFARGKEL